MTPQSGPVLVVEDIPAVRQLVELQLKLRGYPVLTAGDGTQALTMIVDVKPAVVITDVLMPRATPTANCSPKRRPSMTKSSASWMP